jgi:hypothetical protein
VQPLGFYRLSFEALASAPGYWTADFFRRDGSRNYADNYSSFDPATGWTHHDSVFMARHDAAQAKIAFREIATPFQVRRVHVAEIGRDQALAWGDALYAGLPPVPSSVPVHGSRCLDRTRRALRHGDTLRMVVLGDSVANDLAGSHFHLLLERAHGSGRIDLVHSCHPEKCVHAYQRPDRVKAYAVDLEPDVLVIAGMSHRNTAAIRNIVRQVRQRLDPDVLFTNLAITEGDGYIEGGESGFITRVVAAGSADGFAVADLRPCWEAWCAASPRPADWFRRDSHHANDRGKQVMGRLLAACFAHEPEQEEDTGR